MNSNLDKIAKDLYGKIQTRFTDITIGDENAQVLSRKEDIPHARFFEFEYVENGESLGTITVTLDVEDGVVVQVSGDLVDDDRETTHHGAFKFIRSFRQFAKDRLLNFDIQNIGKSNLDKRDYEFQAKRKEEPVMPQQPVMENKLYGSNRVSYQDLGEAKLIIKHTQAVNPLLAAGRTMHIESIYIENAQGERFKYPYKHLSGARALAEHVKHGGIPYDGIGKHIIGLSEELAGLRKFKGYVSRQSQISEAMGEVTGRVIERIDAIKKELHGLQRPAYYETFAESFEEKEEVLVPEMIQNDLIDRLTIRTFNEELKAVFPYIYKFVDESQLPVLEVGADELLGEDEDEECSVCHETPCSCKEEDNKQKDEGFDPEKQFEDFMESIVNEDRDELFSPNKDAKFRAIEKLNQVLEKELPGGPGGINAIESLKGLIDDPEFIESLTDLDPTLDIRPVLQQWLHEHPEKFPGDAAESLAMIRFGGQGEEQPAAPEAPPVPPAPATPPPAPAPEALPAPEAPLAAPPAPEAPPAAPAPVAESGNKAKLKAKFIRARESGATLETQIDLGSRALTLKDAIEECGMTPADVGFEETGIPAMLKYISGFYNKDAEQQLDEGNFTIGGTRMKIKLKKAWEEGQFGNCPPEDVVKVFKFIDSKDPSQDSTGQEQHHILKLAGVARPEEPEVEIAVDEEGTSNPWDIANLENAMKNIKLNFGGEEINLANPDDAQMKRIGGGIMQGLQQQIPDQNVQIPGGQIDPREMMKALMQKINFGN